ncbi:hypothetical protein PAERUG_P60_London_6_VIM_2_11_13_05508 [Pseudomonas aeruginosa]|nr:hypothetical protein PAERUG_E7_London_9_VIM_2_02_13_05979 [Pseudomonas aeruginosa]CRQ64810.1 hypothetical protein PAERUG_P43_2_London_9_VIM_2_11_12_05498 [Pseudomonas aeruginosa]CRQ94555.1 hypothetical protein PAERUG_P43_1_London_9_VIM_2_11_12_05507 [Pseudomonas aeruginosa]CRQ97923.1 hypothetical protein PAERUG_P50_London_9_VIM_2_01_13_05493 [Pseudomonas aeruginosa]CRR73546.1 hypothetical protein PAERUG_P51_2_London_11_VIM_2_02_13_05777 [Pseudomonas aeruginosa]
MCLHPGRPSASATKTTGESRHAAARLAFRRLHLSHASDPRPTPSLSPRNPSHEQPQPARRRTTRRASLHQCPAAFAVPMADRPAVLPDRLPRWPRHRRDGLHRAGADPGLGHRPRQPRSGNERRADRHGLRRPRFRTAGRPLRTQAGIGRGGLPLRPVQPGLGLQHQRRATAGAALPHRPRPRRGDAQRHHPAFRIHPRAPQVAAGDQHVLWLQPGHGLRRIRLGEADPAVRLAQPAAARRPATAGPGGSPAVPPAGIGALPGGPQPRQRAGTPGAGPHRPGAGGAGTEFPRPRAADGAGPQRVRGDLFRYLQRRHPAALADLLHGSGDRLPAHQLAADPDAR